MDAQTQIDNLWEEFKKVAESCLRDYARSTSTFGDIAGLLGRQAANERKQRKTLQTVPSVSISTAAKLMLMKKACRGAAMNSLPDSKFQGRNTATEAEMLGFLSRNHLSKEWRDAVTSLDYQKLTQN